MLFASFLPLSPAHRYLKDMNGKAEEDLLNIMKWRSMTETAEQSSLGTAGSVIT